VRTYSNIVGVLLAGTALTGTWLCAPPTAAQTGWIGHGPLLAALNDCIQERFKDVDEGFGFRRLVQIGETPHHFRPENARELSAVSALERAGLRVVLYLTGRQVLQAKSDRVVAESIAGRQMIKGPALVTSAEGPPLDPPPGMELWSESRRAMALFDRAESHEFTLDAWTFTARPVRAANRACLRCHRADGAASLRPRPAPTQDLRVGDALGVVLYGMHRGR
jgi:hypothetical protein